MVVEGVGASQTVVFDSRVAATAFAFVVVVVFDGFTLAVTSAGVRAFRGAVVAVVVDGGLVPPHFGTGAVPLGGAPDGHADFPRLVLAVGSVVVFTRTPDGGTRPPLGTAAPYARCCAHIVCCQYAGGIP